MNQQVVNVINNVNDHSLDISNFVTTNNWINNIIRDIRNAQRIGGGAVGSVYITQDGRYAVKKITPCRSQQLANYCNDLYYVNQYPFVKIPSANSKWRYILPNLLSEAIIGMFMTQITDLTINATSTLGCLIDYNQPQPEVYIIMEAFNPTITNVDIFNAAIINQNMGMTSANHVLFFLFQISHSLMQLQAKYKFTHYDLHIENTLWSTWPRNLDFIGYPLVNNNEHMLINKRQCPFIVKITDFGLSRMETEQTEITASVVDYPEKTFGEFNPNYDIISLIGTTLMDSNLSPAILNLLHQDLSVYRDLVKLVVWYFDDPTIIPDNADRFQLDNIRQSLARNHFQTTLNRQRQNRQWFRPINYDRFIIYKNTKPTFRFVNYLARLLQQRGLLYEDNPNLSTRNLELLANSEYKIYPDITYNIIRTGFVDVPIPEPDQFKWKADVFIIEPDLVEGRNIKLLYNKSQSKYNWTMTESQKQNCPMQEHYLTEIRIITQSMKAEDWEFFTDCCHLDVTNYTRTNNVFGVVMNGGFFKIRTDYTPVGSYIDPNANINRQVPAGYEDVYGYIYISHNGVINIDQNLDRARVNAKYLLASGPMLIENGDIVYNPNQDRFECTTRSATQPPLQVVRETDNKLIINGQIETKTFMDDYGRYSCQSRFIKGNTVVNNCDRLNPGELSHANNPNPRSALAILSNRDVIFITVEGRENRGYGMDMLTLAKTVKDLHPNVVQLINLDGGTSSNLVWRSENDPEHIYLANPTRNFHYAVGDIFGFRKIQ